MRNWFDIAVPHEDIRKGGFDEAVFAADLGDVAAGHAAPDYNDPYLFFKKTYPTEGLRKLLREVHRKLTQGEGPGIVELQTPFGGGKTHSLVTVYHYLKHGAEIEELLPEEVEPIEEPAISVVVGTQLNPLQGRTTDGVTRRTLWGEVAWQLGGEEAYHEVQENDEEQVTPGKEALRRLLEPRQPFILLFDEILEYIVKSRGVEVKDGTLAGQTLTFFKELTDTVAGLPRGLMIATLPSSDLEDFGDAKQLNLQKLEHIFDRRKTIATPVKGDEVYSIIRRRLFENVKDEAAVREIADAYVQTYQENKNELPPKARGADFRRKIELAYPFHPEVIDTLQEKWGTFSTFQRTRGVLRLLANVIEDLWEREQNIDLILPGDVNLNRSEIRREFIGHIGQEHEAVIASDIAGDDAKSPMMDRENKSWNHLAERVATTVFLHSFSANNMEIGAPLSYIKLGVLRPDTIPSLITEVLQKQRNELWYLNTRDDRYYFSSVPNLNRMVLDKRSVIPPAAVREELEKRVRKELGTKFRCYLWPQSSSAIPDNRELKLAVLDPDSTPGDLALKSWLDRRGDDFRTYKNTLFFAVPDESGRARIREDIRTYLALLEIREEIQSGQRPGLEEKAGEVQRRIRDVEERLPQRIRELYRVALVPQAGGELQRIDLGQPTVGAENLDTWFRRELTEAPHQKILVNPPSATMLRAKFLQNTDAVSLAVVRDQFYKDTTLPAPMSEELITEAVAAAVAKGELGIGRGTADEVDPQSVRLGEQVAATTVELDDDTLLLTKERATALKESVAVPAGPSSEPEGGTQPEPSSGTGGETQTTIEVSGSTPEPDREVVERVRIRASGIPTSKLADLQRGVFLPLTKEAGTFTFTLELDVRAPDGVSKKIIEQQVLETLRQLGADTDYETA